MQSRTIGANLLSRVFIVASVLAETVISQDRCSAGFACRLVGNGSVCELDLEAAPDREGDDPCCELDCFPDTSVFANFQRDSLSISVNYSARDKAILTVQWQYADFSQCSSDTTVSDPPSSVQMAIAQNGKKRCLCLPPGTTSVRTPLWDPPHGCYLDGRSDVHTTVELKVNDPYDGYLYPPSCSDSFVSAMKQSRLVQDCLTEQGQQQSLEVCGVQVPSEPVDVAALATDKRLTVTWAPPKRHNTPIAGYTIDVFQPTASRPLATATVSGKETQYTFEFDKALREEDNPFIMIAAGVHTDDIGFCRGGVIEGNSTVFSSSTRIPVQWPNCTSCSTTSETTPALSAGASLESSTVQSSGVHAIVWPSLGALLLLAAVIMILILFAAKRSRRHIPAALPNVSMMEKGLLAETPRFTRSISSASSIHEQGTVFLGASTEEDEGVKRKVRHLCHVLAERGLTPVYYEYVANDHSADSPSALGMNRWVELQFSRCEFVLFVCTKRFMEEWNGERRDILSPLVYPCRNLLDGSLTRPQNISRYAVLFMCEDRQVPTALKNFKQFELFGLDGDNITADRLVHYLTETPPYVMPQVTNCIPLQQFL